MKVLVTGGGGFLGGALVRRLLEQGHEVRSASRGRYPELEALGVETLQVDLAEPEGALRAVAGVELVFHAAAKAGVWGKREEYRRANVVATHYVVDACMAYGVPRLVHTSSPSVCFDGRDHVMAPSDLPLARRFEAHYPATKAAAERLVLAANGRWGLTTCVLRPHLIFGPGDPHLLPRVVARARARKLAIVGDGENEVTLCYVDNAVHAHVLAAEQLSPTAPHAGRAYFIGQEEPVRLWPWIDALLERLGVPRIERRISLRTARTAGAALELAWRALRLSGEPPMTRFVASQLARSHSYDMRPAREAFGYRAPVGMDEALERTLPSLAEFV